MHLRFKSDLGSICLVLVFLYCSKFSTCSPIPGNSTTVSRNFTEDGQRCSTKDATAVLRNLTSNGYDYRIRPNYGGNPVVVNVSYSVLGFRDIQEVDMTYVTDMYFRQEWQDNRLQHFLNCTLTFITGTKSPVDFIWVPDATFENAVTSYVHDVLIGNHRIDIYPSGKVLWGVRVTAKAFCPMKLSSYPFDVQVCPLTLVSYNYPVSHVKYAWKGMGVSVFEKELSQYDVIDIKTNSLDALYAMGRYSLLNAHFTFKRRLGYFVMQVYTPVVFLVMLAGFSFWMDPRATPARVALSLTTLLTTATIWSSVNSTMPKVSYVKAIDIYFLVSFGFVFSTLLQYILLLTLKHHMYLRKLRKVSGGDVLTVKDGDSEVIDRSVKNEHAIAQAKQRMQRYCSVFDEQLPTQRTTSSMHCVQHDSKENLTRNKKETLDPEALYYYKQKQEFSSILWMDKFSRGFYMCSYFAFLLLYWNLYKQ